MALGRGAADAGLLAAFGAALFRAWLGPVFSRPQPIRVAVAVALAGLGAWAGAVGAALGGSVLDTPEVLLATLFGRVLLLQAAFLLAAMLARPAWLATVLAALSLLGQVAHGHALAMSDGPSWLLLSVSLHLLAAGAWIGGLPCLWLSLVRAEPAAAAVMARRFGTLGTVCVLLIATTATLQATTLMGPLASWPTFAYGRIGLAKLGLFAVLLAVAARNRFRLVPALGGRSTPLRHSIAIEITVGLATVLAAALLASSAPAMDTVP